VNYHRLTPVALRTLRLVEPGAYRYNPTKLRRDYFSAFIRRLTPAVFCGKNKISTASWQRQNKKTSTISSRGYQPSVFSGGYTANLIALINPSPCRASRKLAQG